MLRDASSNADLLWHSKFDLTNRTITNAPRPRPSEPPDASAESARSLAIPDGGGGRGGRGHVRRENLFEHLLLGILR